MQWVSVEHGSCPSRLGNAAGDCNDLICVCYTAQARSLNLCFARPGAVWQMNDHKHSLKMWFIREKTALGC